MGTYLISYDLLDSDKETDLLAYLKNATMATKSAYLLNTNMTPGQLVDGIRKLTNNKVNVYVLTIANPYSGWGPPAANEWLTKNLP